MNQSALLRQEERGMAPITLPTIRGAFRLGAADHPSAPAVGAIPTPRDVVDHHAVAHVETSHAGSDPVNHPTRLVTGNDTPIRFRSGSLIRGEIGRASCRE